MAGHGTLYDTAMQTSPDNGIARPARMAPGRGPAPRRATLLRMLEGMRRGQPWHEAAREAGWASSRSTAYRLLRRMRTEGEEALQDRRHGHPSVLREPVRHWLEAYCRAHPELPGRLIHAALCERFALTVSLRQVNRVRSTLGLGRRTRHAVKEPRMPAT